MKAASTRALLAVAVSGGLATASADGAVAGVPAGPVAGARLQSALRCHLDLPVRVKGHRFVTSYDDAAIACGGTLLGRPVVGGTLPHASGRARLMHWAQALPPEIGKTQLSLHAVGPAVPLSDPDYTAVKLTLTPDPASANGAGHFTGSASIRQRDHQVAASIVFQPSPTTKNRGRLIVDLSAWEAQ